MTNGEKIQSMFSNMNFGTLAQDDVIVNRDYSNNDEPQVFIPKSVWNAEYKEPTTKNDLAVDKSDEFEEWKLNEDKDSYLRIGDIVERFKEIDEHYNHSSWNLTQIFSNLNVLPRVYPKDEALEQEPILDKIRAEIIKYEGDCRLSVDEYPSCKQCTDNVFDTFYAILDKYKAEIEPQESEDNNDSNN